MPKMWLSLKENMSKLVSVGILRLTAVKFVTNPGIVDVVSGGSGSGT